MYETYNIGYNNKINFSPDHSSLKASIDQISLQTDIFRKRLWIYFLFSIESSGPTIVKEKASESGVSILYFLLHCTSNILRKNKMDFK